jgi:hypothetical protein
MACRGSRNRGSRLLYAVLHVRQAKAGSFAPTVDRLEYSRWGLLGFSRLLVLADVEPYRAVGVLDDSRARALDRRITLCLNCCFFGRRPRVMPQFELGPT